VTAGCQYNISGNPDVNLVAAHVSPISATLPVAGKLQLTATAFGSTSPSVSWSILSPSQDSVVATGFSAIYYAPFAERTAVVRLTPNDAPSRYVDCNITIVFPESDSMFAVSPLAATILSGSTLQFFIDTMTTTEQVSTVSWSLVSGPGSLSSAGLYVAPSNIAKDSVVATIQATLVADTNVHSSAQIVLLRSSDSMKCFTRDVLPIFSANCGMSGCHDNGSHGDILSYRGALDRVVLGNARASELYRVITELNADNRMPPPPHSVLSHADVMTIGRWIDEGAQDCE